MPTCLKNLKIKTIGSVDRPANGMAKVVLMKRAEDRPKGVPEPPKATDEATMMQKLFAFAKGLFGPGAKDYSTVNQAQEIEDDLWEKTRTLRESLESIMGDTAMTDKQSAIANSLQQFFSDLVGSVAKAGKKISTSRLTMLKDMQVKLAQLIAEAEATPAPGEKLQERSDEDVTVIKIEDLPEEVRKAIELVGPLTQANEDLRKNLEATQGKLTQAEVDLKKNQEDLKKASDETKTKEIIAKISELKGLAVNPEELAPVLKGFAESDQEGYAKLEDVLKAANEAILKGALFTEIGRGGSGQSDTLTKVKALASEIVTKDASMTKEKALSKVWREHPELYKQYQDDQRRVK